MTTTGSGITAGATIGAKVATVPTKSTTLQKGCQKIVLNIPLVLRPAAWALHYTIKGGQLWDNAVIPAIEKGMALKGVKVHMPRNSVFFLNAAGQVRSTPAKGYQYIVRKSYDKASGQFSIWLVVL